MEIYIHIPFCVKKCDYCDFLSGPADNDTKEKYVKALIKEIEASRYDKYKEDKVTSLFVGGGTPSILNSDEIIRIADAVKKTFCFEENAEISVEMNPGTVTDDKLKALKEAGVTRLSIGLQSANDNELKILGRIHTYDDFLNTFKMARSNGFDNINIDLISAVPGQSIESFSNTLNKVAELGPEHISAYSLIIEEGTLFYDKYGDDADYNDALPLPSEAEDRIMYEDTDIILGKYGYHRYEISNYAKENKECEHNKGYWKCEDYLGLGLGASSLYKGMRFHNTEDMAVYLKDSADPESIKEDIVKLTKEEKIEEFMFLGLRMVRGISLDEFRKRFGINIEEVYGSVIDKFTKEGLIKIEKGRLFLTKHGIDVSNQVFVEFMEPKIIE